MAMSNEASRRASGAAMEASRRAGGAAMEERRRGKQLVDDINSLANPPANRKTLRTVDPVGGVPARRGSGVYQAPATSGTGGGIASPLIEVPNSREFHPTILRPSTDGAVFFEVRVAKKVTMTDANGAQVVMEFSNVNS
ncbi:hypothetical protein OS670_20165 [Pseudomonadaceae bacterium T75]|nr:hypothetical protein OS670_20165 [Pseudomonadaceae bacterium T75]